MKCLYNKFHKFICSNLNLVYSMDKKDKVLFIANSIFVISVIILQLIITCSNSVSAIFLITNIVLFFVYFFALLNSIYKSCKMHELSSYLKQSNSHNCYLQKLNDDTRAFKHDFGNIVQAIGGYIDKNDMEGLKVYYSQLFGDFEKLNNLCFLNPEVINNSAIYQIVSSKYNKATKLGIDFYIDVFLDLNTLSMKIYEFSRVLGILLDNAIEAASECDEKTIKISITKDSKRNRKLLIVENTYKNKNLDIERIFEKGFSSKTHNTGLGLWEVRQILKKNKNLNLYTHSNDTMFIQQLEIYDIVSKTNFVHTDEQCSPINLK